MRLLGIALLLAVGLPMPGQLKEREKEAIDIPRGMVDEDEDLLREKEYAFNPIQAEKELKVGDFYWKKGSHRAAAGRYLEATRWNPNLAEAWVRLGEAREKLKDWQDALAAYRKFLSLAPEDKEARKVGGKVAALEKKIESLPLTGGEGDAGKIDSLPDRVERQLNL